MRFAVGFGVGLIYLCLCCYAVWRLFEFGGFNGWFLLGFCFVILNFCDFVGFGLWRLLVVLEVLVGG